MFRKNTDHLQPDLFDLEALSSEAIRDYRGFTGDVIETGHPDNPISLITDVSTQTNNVDDSRILADRLDAASEVMPDVEEFLLMVVTEVNPTTNCLKRNGLRQSIMKTELSNSDCKGWFLERGQVKYKEFFL